MKQTKRIFIIVIVVIILFLSLIFGYYKMNFIGKNKVQDVVVKYMDLSKKDVFF